MSEGSFRRGRQRQERLQPIEHLLEQARYTWKDAEFPFQPHDRLIRERKRSPSKKKNPLFESLDRKGEGGRPDGLCLRPTCPGQRRVSPRWPGKAPSSAARFSAPDSACVSTTGVCSTRTCVGESPRGARGAGRRPLPETHK
jgi:hypothetical protein